MNGFLARPSAAYVAGVVAVSGVLALGVMGGATADPHDGPVVAVPESLPSGAANDGASASSATPSKAPSSAAPMPTATLSTTGTPTPAPTRSTAPAGAKPATPAQAAKGTALAAVASLAVKGRAPKTGYSREQFGQAWFDADRNGCDTRNDVLRRDLVNRDMKNWCKVLAGTRRPDPYTGATIRFVSGGASEIDVDHVVALSDAWQKGAASWRPEKRLAFANDPLNLLAVAAGANRSKGDGDVATWLPPAKAYRCTYVARVVAIKLKYRVWVTAPEHDAMVRILSQCAPATTLPAPGPAPTTAALPKSKPRSTPTVAAPQKTTGAEVYYKNCTAVRAAGAAPIRVGQPGYGSHLDRDHDGVGCES